MQSSAAPSTVHLIPSCADPNHAADAGAHKLGSLCGTRTAASSVGTDTPPEAVEGSLHMHLSAEGRHPVFRPFRVVVHGLGNETGICLAVWVAADPQVTVPPGSPDPIVRGEVLQGGIVVVRSGPRKSQDQGEPRLNNPDELEPVHRSSND